MKYLRNFFYHPFLLLTFFPCFFHFGILKAQLAMTNIGILSETFIKALVTDDLIDRIFKIKI